MAFNGSGSFSLAAGNPVVTGTTISSTWANNTLSDIATGLSTTVLKDGQQTITANLPMAGFRHTGVGNATTRAALTYASAADVQDGTLIYLTAPAGTNTITATAAISMTAYAAGQSFILIPANTNTGATTLQINGIAGAKNVFWNGAACVGGELRQGVPVRFFYDGTQFNITGNGFNAPFLDTHAIVEGSADSTKKLRAEVDGLTTATTRVWTVQNKDITVAGLDDITIRRNRVKNGAFQVDQLVNSATSVADDVYCLDCWYVLTQTAAIQVTQQTLQESGQPYNIRLTQNQAAAQRMGIAQIVEARDSQQDRGSGMVLSARVRISNSQAVRYAILEWTGTADSVTSDVVLDWTSSTYTANNFFLAANLTVTAVGSITPSANTWTAITALTGTAGSSLNNWVVFFWTEGTAAQNVTLDVGLVQHEPGSSAATFQYRTFEEDYQDSMRYFEKSFAYGTAPGTAASVGAATFTTASTTHHEPVYFKAQKRTTPTMTAYNSNSGATTTWRDTTSAADRSVTWVNTGDKLSNGQVIPTAAGDAMEGQWTADARL